MVLEVGIVSTFEETGEDVFGEERERGFSSGMWSNVYFLACMTVKCVLCGKSTWARHFGGKHFSVYVWCFTIKSFYILFFQVWVLIKNPWLVIEFWQVAVSQGRVQGSPMKKAEVLPFFLLSLSIKCRQRSHGFSLLFVNMANWYFQTWNYPCVCLTNFIWSWFIISYILLNIIF